MLSFIVEERFSKMEIYKELGEIVRNARIDRGMTMKDLAVRVGITESAIHHYEMGVRKMSFDTFVDICKALGLDSIEVAKKVLK